MRDALHILLPQGRTVERAVEGNPEDSLGFSCRILSERIDSFPKKIYDYPCKGKLRGGSRAGAVRQVLWH